MSASFHHYGNQTPRSELEASDALRVQWHAWMGRTDTPRAQALADIGWAGAKQPKWIGQGNIPEQYRFRIARQINAQAVA
jgi:hypothetical protein